MKIKITLNTNQTVRNMIPHPEGEMELSSPSDFFQLRKRLRTEALMLVDGEIVRAPDELQPVPTEVLTYKVFGQLAKEVMQGDDEQMQADLTQAGTMTNLLMEMTKAAPEEDIPVAMKPVALNEIERTQTIQRKHPFIDLYGPAFGYVTEEEKDQFFIRAQNYKFGA